MYLPPSAAKPSLDDVESLFGPGVVACWLLVALACILSWIANSTNRQHDKLDPNFMGSLGFPMCTAIYLLGRMRELQKATVPFEGDDAALLSYLAQIEAATIIVETGSFIAWVFVGITLYYREWRRFAVALCVASFCVVTGERVVYFVDGWTTSTQIQSSRRYISENWSVMERMVFLVFFGVAVNAAPVVLLGLWGLNPSGKNLRRLLLDHFSSPTYIFLNLPIDVQFFSRRASPFIHCDTYGPRGKDWWKVLGGQLWFYIPQTKYRWQDLDQKFTLLTGFYILAYAFVESEWYIVLKGIVDQGLLKLRYFVEGKLQRHSRLLFQVWSLADRVWESLKSELEEMQRRDEKRSRERRKHRASTCVDDSMTVSSLGGLMHPIAVTQDSFIHISSNRMLLGQYVRSTAADGHSHFST